MSDENVRPTLRSVIGRGHLILALVAVTLASVSLTLLGVLALRVYAEQTAPVAEHFEKLGRLRIVDGVGEVDAVFRRILAALPGEFAGA